MPRRDPALARTIVIECDMGPVWHGRGWRAALAFMRDDRAFLRVGRRRPRLALRYRNPSFRRF